MFSICRKKVNEATKAQQQLFPVFLRKKVTGFGYSTHSDYETWMEFKTSMRFVEVADGKMYELFDEEDKRFWARESELQWPKKEQS